MQKLICTILASAASAGELFLTPQPSLDKDLINTSLDIKIQPDSILPCQYFTQTAVFNFQNVLTPGSPGSPTETQMVSTYSFTEGASPKVAFNWCEDPFAAKSESAFFGTTCIQPDSNAFVFVSNTCNAFNPVDDSKTGNTAGFEITDAEGNVQGVSLIYEGGSCGDSKYQLNVTAMCPAGGKNGQLPVFKDSSVSGSCNYTVVYETDNGCAVFSLSQLTRFFYKYSYLFGAVLIGAGFFLAFLGNKFVNVVIFLVSAFALMIIGSSLFINLALEKVDKEWVVWTAFVVIVLVSLGIGLLMVKFRKYGVGIFAAWGGVMLGFLVTTTFAVANKYAFYAILIAGAVGMFFVAIKIEKTVIILLTAFLGSYAFVRGISLYAGGFPSETELHDELAAGIITWDTMPKTYYAYLGGIIVMFFVSAIYQIKHNQKKEKDRAQLKTFMK